MLTNGAMDLSEVNTRTEERTPAHFCTLAYRPEDWDVDSPQIAPIILLVLREQTGRLLFLVHPDVGTVVRCKDLVLIESLIQDLLGRAKLYPEALFKHLCSLGVGLLITQDVGSNISEHPSIKELFSRFVEIK
jgi:hypothetical protein